MAACSPNKCSLKPGKVNNDEWYGTQMQAEPPSPEDEFMNYGLYTEPLHPDAMDHAQSHMANMYAQLASGTSLTGLRVLEVGSGRGGGANFLHKCYCPALYVGMDFEPSQVQSANERFADSGSCTLEFVQGDAISLPFPDSSFDVVINVESSHCYSDFQKFLTEVRRVLIGNGTFLYEDFRPHQKVQRWIANLKDVLGEEMEATEITSQVDASANLRKDYINRRIERCMQFGTKKSCESYWLCDSKTLTTMMFKIRLHSG